jgi:hypothetical protein
MTKFIHSPGAAYEVAIGITAQEAAEQGLAIVEQSYSTNPPTPIFGRYLDAPKGHALGITVDDTVSTKVIGAGGSVYQPGSPGGDKGSLLNLNDPVVHGGTGDETVHADGAAPLKDDAAEQEDLLKAGAHNPSKAPATGKDAKAHAK